MKSFLVPRSLPGQFMRWFVARPLRVTNLPVSERESSFVMTGPDLIEKVARAIQLGQSIILEGPRGCGKSTCVRKGIELAERRGVILRGASVFLQGNREIPRDYLAEDEIAFKIVSKEKIVGKDKDVQVVPYPKSAPLFRFAKRDPIEGVPEKRQDHEGKKTKEVVWEIDGKEMNRFVLFLDEINRFSDGVLDSLLSVLEERTAVLRGEEYSLPVTVCMTMNPPGYDSSARKLSPPLAARIGRNYRLSTPDMDTMTDFIVPDRLNIAKKQFLLRSDKAGETDFPTVSPLLVRKACLVTLCLWGDVSMEEDKPGLEYLTDDTKEMLRKVMGADREISNAMRTISDLCHYGPDGRAVGDWLVSGVATAIAKESEKGVTEEHLLDTVVDTICHKIYDNFSPATRPDLTVRKEEAVAAIARQVLFRRGLDSLLLRLVDEERFLWKTIGEQLFPGCSKWPKRRFKKAREDLRNAFAQSRVTNDIDVGRWCVAIDLIHEGKDAANALECAGEPENLERLRTMLKCRSTAGVAEFDYDAAADLPPIMLTHDGGSGFTHIRHLDLCGKLVEIEGVSGALVESLAQVREQSGFVRRTLRDDLREIPIVRRVGVDNFMSHIGVKLSRNVVLSIAREMEELANGKLWNQYQSAVSISRNGRQSIEDAQTYFRSLLEEVKRQSKAGISSLKDNDLMECLNGLIPLIARAVFQSGEVDSVENGDVLIAFGNFIGNNSGLAEEAGEVCTDEKQPSSKG